jgi:alpha-L-arabinofuranosidase
VETGRWYDLRLEVAGHKMRGYVDNKLVIEAQDEEPPTPVSTYATATYATDSREVIVKVVNTGSEPMETAINLRGAGGVGTAGKAIVIAGEPDAVNSIKNPTNVAPKQEPLSNVAATFTRTFPAHSITLLRFPAKR